MDVIRPIGSETVHRICSGQVVFNLANAVKELIENSLDASARSVEIRLRDYGLESVEVSDNGHGIHPDNFQALTLKHHTSKLRDFADLAVVSTLGFRGEALSSLCELADVTITTRHRSATHATRIRYDTNGRITAEGPAAREVGTTVRLDNLFGRLPVRRKQFENNAKRDYEKACRLLYAYCLVCKGVKFTCTNRTKSGSFVTSAATEGSDAVRRNVADVFGAKQASSLRSVELHDPDRLVSADRSEFLVSDARGARAAPDRQFFYVNGRPCDAPAISRVINEVYGRLVDGGGGGGGGNRYPFVFLNVEIERALIDVNVTPDKRRVFVENERHLLDVVRNSLLAAFKDAPATYEVEGGATLTPPTPPAVTSKGTKRPLASFKKAAAATPRTAPECKRARTAPNDDSETFRLDREPEPARTEAVHVRSSIDYLRDALNSCRRNRQQPKTPDDFAVHFRAEIAPSANERAERELRTRIAKPSFREMEVVGQFNLGFVVARLGDDLFVIDQHAADEKYHFEELQANTVLESQTLVSPKQLELTVVNEETLIENQEVFRKNGFAFVVDRAAPPTRRVKLTAIPVSRSYAFGRDDVEEMLFMLQEGVAASECRPSRVRAMFASRACRKSVMVGCPLAKTDMRRLLDRMSEIEQPWNCPHGRPTMRHLVNLKLLETPEPTPPTPTPKR